jgi:hypothetical protein
LGEEIVADQNRCTGTEDRIERRFAASQRGAVDRVVMNQGCGVQQLDAGRGSDQLIESGLILESAAGEEQNQGAEAFPARLNNVIDEGRRFGVIDLGDLRDSRIHALEIGAHAPKDIRAL